MFQNKDFDYLKNNNFEEYLKILGFVGKFEGEFLKEDYENIEKYVGIESQSFVVVDFEDDLFFWILYISVE